MKGLLVPTDRGLYCEPGDFYVDPWEPVPRAVVTHAHSDHARWGCESYLTSRRGVEVLRVRVGQDASIRGLEFGESLSMGGVGISLHPAGHILGSSQIRIEHRGEVWVVSGDYKVEADATCDPFEPVRCDTFVTETTFALPIYRWQPQQVVFDEINAWWRANAENGRTSIIYCYALGKAQRLLSGVDPAIGPILLHGALQRFSEPYRNAGVVLPHAERANLDNVRAAKGRALVLAPPSAAASPWLRRFDPSSTAFASGWMRIRGARRRRSVDRGFVLSDHADWPGLHDAISATGASGVWATHGYSSVMVRWLQERGLQARAVATRWEGEMDDSEADAAEAAAAEAADATDEAGDALPALGPG